LKRQVVLNAETRDQVELLKHQPQPVAPHGRPLRIGEAGDGLAAEPDLAAIGGIEARDQVQQRALAAAGFTRQRNALAGGDVEAYPAQYADLLAGRAIGLGQVTNAQHNDIAFMRRSISAAA
jgi:hypothetical protein